MTRAGPGGMTHRQIEIASLISQDCSCREVGERLFISERTVEWHIQQICNKLGFNNRAQIASWVGQSRPELAGDVRLPQSVSTFVGRHHEVTEARAAGRTPTGHSGGTWWRRQDSTCSNRCVRCDSLRTNQVGRSLTTEPRQPCRRRNCRRSRCGGRRPSRRDDCDFVAFDPPCDRQLRTPCKRCGDQHRSSPSRLVGKRVGDIARAAPRGRRGRLHVACAGPG